MSSSEHDDLRLHTLGVRLVLAVMRSASTEKIRPTDWWTRAQSALKGAASMAQNYGHMTSVMGRKLQIDTFHQVTANEISSIGEEVAEPDQFDGFRYTCERDALYIVAEAQARRQIERESKEHRHGDADEEIRKAGL